MGKKYNPVAAIISIFIYAVIADFLNFSAALAGSGIPPFNIFVSIVFMALWCWQLSNSLNGKSKFFTYFTIGYWLIALVFYWMTYFSMAFGIKSFAIFGFIGMLMLYIPLYPFAAIIRYFLHVDYYIAFTIAFFPCFAVLMLVFFRKWKEVSQAVEDEKLLDELSEDNGKEE